MTPQPEHFWTWQSPDRWAVFVPNQNVCTVRRIWFASQMFYFSRDPANEPGRGNLWLQNYE